MLKGEKFDAFTLSHLSKSPFQITERTFQTTERRFLHTIFSFSS